MAFEGYPRRDPIKYDPATRPKPEWWRGASLVILAPLALLILYAAFRVLMVLARL